MSRRPLASALAPLPLAAGSAASDPLAATGLPSAIAVVAVVLIGAALLLRRTRAGRGVDGTDETDL